MGSLAKAGVRHAWYEKTLVAARSADLRTSLRIGSCRFTAFYWMSCAVGLCASGRGTAFWLAFTFGFWLLYCLASELLNRLADRAEDEVNRIERTALCERLGFDRVRVMVVVLYALVVIWAGVWFALAPSPALAGLLAFDVLVSYNYSRGIRLKRRRWLGTLALMTPVTAPLLTGWATGGTLTDLVEHGVPLALVLALFFGGLVGIKDLTDVAGDRAVGYSSVWVAVAAAGRRLPLVAAGALPFLLLLGLVLGGVVPSALALLLALAPASAAVILAASRADSEYERAVAREAMYQHTALFLTLTLAIVAVSSGVVSGVVVSVLGLAGWQLASRQLHWNRLLTLRDAQAWLGLLVHRGPRRELA
jgi:4-hydroxybenzoate polyprenyltransferase